ncbi:butyrate kinase [Staphylococcus americanisciuri]|uniref:Probable butyrate kinase n=1 Tax=Staphylococcus americanisciuri TaxID=2973940 RepID=A0ABT2EZ45_9STAP|nr:butyrate kinase [Staphylococcus americanisciuri]MCS4485499.1 butyrate kinase [Staphylococcus americanisciuri]
MTQILVLNLGSTSSKIAIYQDNECLFEECIVHDMFLLSQPLAQQAPLRQKCIEQTLEQHQIYLTAINAIACRGGLLKPIVGGTYAVNDKMYTDLENGRYGLHASNLSGMIGYQLGKLYKIPVYTTDPVVIDELIDEVRYTGLPDVSRKSIFHALNHKAVARCYAKNSHKNYEDVNVIVAHMGGGISIAAHRQGRVIDVNEALYGEGPMALTRAGSIPNDLLLQFAQDSNYTVTDMKDYLTRQSGIKAYTGTTDFKALMNQYNTDSTIKQLIDALAIQIAKAIGERAALLKGQVDQIIFTGGISYNQQFISLIQDYIEWIAPITIYAGEYEMTTLAEQAYLAYHQQISINTYR